MKHLLPMAVLATLLCGCSTPPAVYDLAGKSGSNAGVFQGHLATLSSQSSKLAQARVDNILVMQADITRLEAELRREMFMQQQSRSAAEWDEINQLLQRLTALRDRLVEIEASAVFAPEQRRKELLEGHKDLDTHKAALRDAAAALSSLAERESKEEQAKFLAGFAKSVRADFKKAVESGDQNAVNAKALIDKIKADISGDASQ